MVKSVYCKLESSDKVREMLVASANYSQDLGLYPVQEIVLHTEDTPKSSRKRRLDHLSAEEKMKRKKLKNREAAQSSRDRKKAYLTGLEQTIRLLKQENKLLSERVELLEEENRRLSAARGPAVSRHPLQQGAALSRLAARSLLSTLTVLTCWTGWLGTWGSTTQTVGTSLPSSTPSSQRISSPTPPLRKMGRSWWGPGGGKRAWRPPPPLCLLSTR